MTMIAPLANKPSPVMYISDVALIVIVNNAHNVSLW